MFRYIGDFKRLKEYGFEYIDIFSAYYYCVGNIAVGDETMIDPKTGEMCGLINSAVQDLVKDGLMIKEEYVWT